MYRLSDHEDGLKNFLKIADVVKVYGWYVLRKTIGTLYVTISATIGIVVSVLLIVVNLLSSPLLEILIFVIPFIGIATILLFASQMFSTFKVYPIEIRNIRSRKVRSQHVWLILLLIIFLVSISVKFFAISVIILALTIHFSVAIGNMGNYIASRYTENYPGKISEEYLYISIIGFATGPFIILFPHFEWLIVTIVNLVGSYVFGIYLIASSSKLLSEI